MSNNNTASKTNSKHSRKKTDANRIIRTVLSCLFSFLTALSLLVISTACIARIVLSEDYMKFCMDPSYYEGLKESLDEEIWDYTIPTGIDPEVTEGIFDEATIRSDMEAFIENTFKIRQYTIDTSRQETALKEKVIAFLEAEGTPTEPVNVEDYETELDEDSVKAYNEAVEETNAAVDEYVSEIMEKYCKRIKTTPLDYVVKIGNDFQKYFPFLLIISILLGLINTFLCVKIHRLPHRGLRYLVYAFSGGFLMTFTAPFIVYLNGFYNRLGITPVYFKDFLAAFIKGALALFMITAQIWLLIAIILGIIVAVLRKKSIKNRKESSGRREHKTREADLYEEADLTEEAGLSEETDLTEEAGLSEETDLTGETDLNETAVEE